MTEIEKYQPPTAAVAPMPSPQEFDIILRQADVIANAGIVPAAYRRNPANVVVATLTGRTFGWDALTAMRNIHVIEGTASIKPEAMLGLIRGRGHSITGESAPGGAWVTGKRADTGDTMTVRWDVEDAKRAGLWGKKGPWVNYPASMFWARVVAQLARQLFPDVVLGLSYVPEELGANVDADGQVIDGAAFTTQAAPAPAVPPPADLDALIAGVTGQPDPARALWSRGKAEGWLTEAISDLIRDAAVAGTVPQQSAPVFSGQADAPASGQVHADGTVEAEVVDDPLGDYHPEAPAGGGITPQQLKALQAGYRAYSREDRLAHISATVGREVTSASQLTEAEARQVIAAVSSRDPWEA